jgi:hypothetical protein
MAFVNVNHPLLSLVGLSEGHLNAPTSAGFAAVAALNTSIAMFGQVWTEDGGSHTIDTTGLSSIGWLSTGVTFVDAGTTLKVGLCDMDTATGNPIRPSNALGVINFNVSRSIVGGSGGIAANTWNEHAPNAGSKTIAHGDLVGVALQMTARGGSDSVTVAAAQSITSAVTRPGVITYNGTTFATTNVIPNCSITFKDGAKGFLVGGAPYRLSRTQVQYNSSSAPNEIGMLFEFPVPMVLSGVSLLCGFAANAEIIAYLDPLGTPTAQRTVSVTVNSISNQNQVSASNWLFSAPLIVPANTPVVLAVKPTTTTNILWGFRTLGTIGDQKAYGFKSYAVERSSGAFASRGSGLQRMQLSPIAGALWHHARPSLALGI